MTRLLRSFLATAAVVASFPALAQQAGDGAQVAALDGQTYAPATENVIVTARHAREREQDVPISMSVVTADTLDLMP